MLTTALPATFIGMLLVQALRPAEADAAPERPDGQQGPQPEPGHAASDSPGASVPPVLLGADHTAETGHALIAPGSILLTGSLIDAGALTQLSGTSRFAELALHAPAPAAEPAFQLVSTDSHAADVTPAAVSLTPPAPLELPSFQLASTTGTGSTTSTRSARTSTAGARSPARTTTTTSTPTPPATRSSASAGTTRSPAATATTRSTGDG